ncbi:MAG: hypothetical protein NTV52_21590, partial [Acidobacteria bacterium]|nr:hypothetical protein [Acidobacteriota bacterium]
MKPEPKKTGTTEEYAKHSGLNPSTIRNYISIGKLTMVDVGGKRLIDFAASDEMLAATIRRPRKEPVDAAALTGTSASDVEYRKNFALARRREVELAQLEGRLVSAEEVNAAWVKVLSVVKTAVLRIPDRAAQQAAA